MKDEQEHLMERKSFLGKREGPPIGIDAGLENFREEKKHQSPSPRSS